MKPRVLLITLFLLGLCLPHSAESTNTVSSKAVGVIRVTVAPSNSVLSALPVAPFDPRLSRVLANSDLVPGTNASTADNLLLFDPDLAQYDVYFQNSALGGIWVKDPETNETTNTLSPGTGFFILNRDATATAQVFFAGAVILADSNSVTVPQDLSLRSYLFTSAASLGGSGKDGCILAINRSFSSRSETVSTLWPTNAVLFDFTDTNSAPHAVTNNASSQATLTIPARSYRVYVRQP